jgi:hypothetical protein
VIRQRRPSVCVQVADVSSSRTCLAPGRRYARRRNSAGVIAISNRTMTGLAADFSLSVINALSASNRRPDRKHITFDETPGGTISHMDKRAIDDHESA